MKKTLSLILALCLILSLTSVAALAAEGDPAEEVPAAAVTEEMTAEEPAAEEAAEPGEKKSDLKSVFRSELYVKADEDAGLAGDIKVDLDLLGSIGTLYLPGKVDASKLNFFWDDDTITVSRDGTVYESGTAPVAEPGKSITYKIKKNLAFALLTVKTVQGSPDVEPLYLELDESLGTIDAMNSDKAHETSCYGKAIFDGKDNYNISIKGRGNSTWDLDKKPYNITFYKKSDFDKKKNVEMIPGCESKKWSIVANHFDATLLRNKIAMDLAKSLGIGLDARFVDIWMNGEYLGNYLMTPKNDYAAPDGGYALENDNYLESEDPQFMIPGMYEIGEKIHDDGYYNRMTVKDIGDDAADAGVDAAAIEKYFLEAWDALEDYDSEEYQKYFDLDSWAKMFLMYEVSKTYDCYAGSLLMHRDGLTEDDKLIAGPAWDYDVAFGRTLHKFLVAIAENVQVTAEGWFNDSIGMMSVDRPISLLQELGRHDSFMQAVAKVYNENKSVFEALPKNVETQKEILRDSALMNNVKWGTHHLNAEYVIAPNTMHIIGTGKYALNYNVTVDWDAYVSNLKEYCTKRVLWLSDHLYAEKPEGSIVKKHHENGPVILHAELTKGTQHNTYQWQKSADNGDTWEDIDDATESKYIPADEEALYRCVVTNDGVDIITQHGGKVTVQAQTALDPAKVTVTLQKVDGPKEGTLTLVMNGADMGEYTFASSGGGWTMRNDRGKYLATDGKIVTFSDKPFVWSYRNGGFSASVKVSLTLLGRALKLGRTQTVYLTENDRTLTVSTSTGKKAILKEAVTG